MRLAIRGKVNPNSTLGKEISREAKRRAEQERGERELLERAEAAERDKIDAEARAGLKAAAEPQPARDPIADLHARVNSAVGGIPLNYRDKFKPPGWRMREDRICARMDEIRGEERAKEERDAGVPEAQAAYDKAEQKIKATEAARIREIQATCSRDEQAAREAAKTAKDDLGDRPTLESVEKVSA